MHHINHHSLTLSFLKKALLGVGLMTLSVMTFALPNDRNKPISLLADYATYNDKTGITTYKGNVIIEQGTMKLQAASLVANLNQNKQITTIVANG